MDIEEYAKLLPTITESSRSYWEGLESGELRLQLCLSCGAYRFPDSPVCGKCLSSGNTWQRVSGRGRVWSWIVMHQQYFVAFRDEAPYVVALIKLDEGPRMISTVVGPPGELRVDAAVEVFCESCGVGNRYIPKFRLVR